MGKQKKEDMGEQMKTNLKKEEPASECGIPDIVSATTLSVGILSAPEICFQLNGNFTHSGNEEVYSGSYQVYKENGQIILEQDDQKERLESGVIFTPTDYDTATFLLAGVTIGIQFHWERSEEQLFKGSLKVINEESGELLTAINLVPLEEYLFSVISSEMSASSPTELLKAHAVISRSWLLAQREKAVQLRHDYTSRIETAEELVQWYDREEHTHFDVCADDHCQRYQGITRAYTPEVEQAVKATTGEVLTFNGKICDTRFSKCCGGATELFENTWEPVSHPYLSCIADKAANGAGTAAGTPLSDLTIESNARQWISGQPEAFCNTSDPHILSVVLNNYDQETPDFFRWKVSYTTKELSALVKQRTGIDFGTIRQIEPVERGASGRLIKVRISGSFTSRIIGKELLIRKAFSPSHLYSSAFIVETTRNATGHPTHFHFHGAGWGHGVGLCQIGAAVMATRGYTYREILNHYFPGARLSK